MMPVAPHAGAWIETRLPPAMVCRSRVSPVHMSGCGLKNGNSMGLSFS